MDLLQQTRTDQLRRHKVVDGAAINRRFHQELRDGFEGIGNDELSELRIEIRLEIAEHQLDLLE